MIKQESLSAPIYRFKFSDTIIDTMKEFARIHKYDDRTTFKESWNIWVKQKSTQIDKEKDRLMALGFNGNIEDKMYKSIRYYYCKKDTQVKAPKPRKEYVPIHPNVLDVIDKHINNTISSEMSKPSECFTIFEREYDSIINNEIERLKKCSYTYEEAYNKLKKTYKNRYFIQRK